MRAECVTAITNAAAAMGRKLTQADLRGIEDRIRGNKKALQQQDSAAYLAMSPAERIKKAGEMAAEQTLHEAIKKRQQADRQVQVRSKIMDYLGAATAKGMTGAEALQHYLFKNSDGKGGVQSVESWIKAVSTDYKSQLDVMLKYFSDNETLGIFASKEGNMEFIKAARGKSTNPKAIEAYNAFKKMNDAMIDQFNRLGGNLDKRADWGTPQKLNAYRLLQMTEAKFIDEWINFVDRTKYAKDDGTLLNDAEMRSFLKEAYATMVTGGGQKKPGEGTGSLANRRQTHRQLHYTADGYAKAMDMAGAGSVLEQIHSHIDGLAKDIALVEMMGPNAERTYQEMRAHVVDTSPKTPKTESLLKNMDTAFDQVYGIDRSDLSVSARHTLNELKSWQIVAKLGSMLLAQIGDITTIKTTADAMNIPMSAILSNAAKYATSPEYRSPSRSMGFAMESLAHSVARFGDESSSYGMASKGAALLVKMQGATAWNNMWRAAFGNAMAAQTSQMNTKFKAMKDLPDYDRRVLESKGVTEQDWKLWKMAQRDGYGMIGAKSVADVDVQALQQKFGFATEIEAYDFRRESSIKLMSMLLEETHMAVLDPSAGSRAAVTNVVGSGYMTLMAQFKQFPVAYFREHFIQRAQFAAEMGRSPLAYRAKLIGLSTVFGGVSLVLGDIASGRDPRDITLENDPAFALKAMFRGGGFGIFNDLLEVMIDPNMSKEKAVAKLATGPAFTAAGGVLAAIPDAGAAGIAAAKGDEVEYEKRRKEFSKGMYQTVKENTPFQNFWPTKALVHNIILHDLQELANPGYMERAKEAAEKRYKAGFWLTPDETRAPDFGNIFGQGEQQ